MKFISLKNVLGLAGAVALSAHLISKKKKRFDFVGKIALITGGSRDLGLSLAWNLLAQGSSVALVARDRAELERAKGILLNSFPDSEIVIYSADITKPTQLKNCIDDCKKHFGRIDLLVNNAGSIEAAPYLYAAINAIKFVVPYFQQRGTGRILNVCSPDGKFSIPQFSSKDVSKFALTGFSQGIQPELAADNIFMTTAFCTSMSADKAAKQILKAVERGKSEVILSVHAKIHVILGTLVPNIKNAVSRFILRFLPNDSSKFRKTASVAELKSPATVRG